MAGNRSFSELPAEKILLPLGLTSTFFAAHEDLPTGTARGYDMSLLGTGRLGIKKDMEALRIPFETSAFTAGAVTASASDVARFTYSLFEGRLLGKGGIRLGTRGKPKARRAQRGVSAGHPGPERNAACCSRLTTYYRWIRVKWLVQSRSARSWRGRTA